MIPDYVSPEYGHSALLTIDVQRDFLDDAPFEIPGTSAVLPAVMRVVEAYRRVSLPIVHVVRLYEPGGVDVDLPRRAAVEAGLRMVAPYSVGSQLPAGLLEEPQDLHVGSLLRGEFQKVGPREWIMFKPRWGAFYRTPLERLLADHGVSTVVVLGCNLPNCPRATLVEASERDYRTVLVEDGVSQASEERIADLVALGVTATKTQELVEYLDSLA